MRGRPLSRLRPYRLALALGLAALIAASCATTSRGDPFAFKTASLFGMVYDYDNRECSGVHLVVDGKERSTTDIDGRFVLPDLARGVHTVMANEADYEPLSVVFDFESPTQVLYLKMYSFDELLDQAEIALDKEQWLEAGLLLKRAAAVRAQDAVLGYLEAILAYKRKDYAAAAVRLRSLVASGNQDPYVYLFLADLYQYRLGRPELAVRALGDYLKLAGNPDVEKRLRALEDAVAARTPAERRRP